MYRYTYITYISIQYTIICTYMISYIYICMHEYIYIYNYTVNISPHGPHKDLHPNDDNPSKTAPKMTQVTEGSEKNAELQRHLGS